MRRRIFSRGEKTISDRLGSKHHERAADIDSRIDTDTGEFDMIQATEGEATDGHILSIRGLDFPEEMPLQLDHSTSALRTLGTVTRMRRDTRDGVRVLRGVGQIRLTGEGEALEARRDLVDGIANGAVRSVSLTWEAFKATERRDLPKTHAAHVARDESDPRKRFGLYFEKTRALEQSIVGIGADRSALIGRSEGAENDLSRELWQTILHRLDDAPRSREWELIDALERSVRDLEVRLQEAEATHAPSDDLREDPPTLESMLETLTRRLNGPDAPGKDALSDQLETLLQRIR